MKLSTMAISLGPVVVLTVAAIVTGTLEKMSWPMIIVVGVASGAFGGFAARLIEPKD